MGTIVEKSAHISKIIKRQEERGKAKRAWNDARIARSFPFKDG